MTESRIHHQHVRILPRKAQESLIHHEDPLKRRIPLIPDIPPVSPATINNGDNLTRRQRSQRRRREREKGIKKGQEMNIDAEELAKVRISDVAWPSPARKIGDELTRRQRSQRERRQREKSIRNAHERNIHAEDLHSKQVLADPSDSPAMNSGDQST